MEPKFSEKQVALEKILKKLSVAGKFGARILVYTTALGSIMLIGGVHYPHELEILIGNLGINILSTLVDRIANGESIPRDEVQRQVERAISESKIDRLLTKDEFSQAVVRLLKNQQYIRSVVDNNSTEIKKLSADVNEMIYTLKHRDFLRVNIGNEIFEISQGDKQKIDKVEGDNFLNHSLPEITGTVKLGKRYVIVLIDIDKLTQINKRFGNDVGDEVLLAISRTIAKVGESTFFGRCGDDTFYLIHPTPDNKRAEYVIQTLRLQIMYLPWDNLATDLRVTCSFGLAIKGEQESVGDALTRAAIGMTKAKENGGNAILYGPKFKSPNATRGYHDYYS